jgi:hypothetical protein
MIQKRKGKSPGMLIFQHFRAFVQLYSLVQCATASPPALTRRLRRKQALYTFRDGSPCPP